MKKASISLVVTLPAVLCLFTLFGGISHAVILIDAATRNGSFETGQWSPWNAYNYVLINSASFASDGSYYAKLETTTGRELISQTFSIDKNNGSLFLFRADARNGVNPFDTIQLMLYGQTYSGQFVNATLNIFNIPASAANTWVTFSATATFQSAAWQALNPAKIWVNIQFTKNGFSYGTLYQGFLDNIKLQQVPEPANLSFLAVGIMVLFKKRQ
jgi:hypothetical protein